MPRSGPARPARSRASAAALTLVLRWQHLPCHGLALRKRACLWDGGAVARAPERMATRAGIGCSSCVRCGFGQSESRLRRKTGGGGSHTERQFLRLRSRIVSQPLGRRTRVVILKEGSHDPAEKLLVCYYSDASTRLYPKSDSTAGYSIGSRRPDNSPSAGLWAHAQPPPPALRH